MTKNVKKGFTLVELLVVIGIIAVLISILLPSLSRARQSALSLQCAANLRTIGQALMMYVDSNKGFYPHGSCSGPDRYVQTTLGSVLASTDLNPWNEGANAQMAYFKCPAVVMEKQFPWTPAIQYAGHPVVFPSNWWASQPLSYPVVDMADPLAKPMPLYKASWMAKGGTTKAIFWDGNIMTDPTDWNTGMCQPTAEHVDNDGMWGGDGATCLVDTPDAWNNPADPANPAALGSQPVGLNGVWKDRPNNGHDFADGEDPTVPTAVADRTMNTFRVRHVGDTVCNFLFADGHVESRIFQRQGVTVNAGTSDMTKAEFAVPFPVPGRLNAYHP